MRIAWIAGLLVLVGCFKEATVVSSDGNGSDGAADTTSSESNGTTGGLACGCAFIQYAYFCAVGESGGDPDNQLPYDCPEGLREGDACDNSSGPVTELGCCLNRTDVAICLDGNVAVLDCTSPLATCSEHPTSG